MLHSGTMKIGLARLIALTFLVCSGCGGDSALEDELVGAWYGDGPDGDQCFVFCGDGRLFWGDRPCDDSEASDFENSLTASFGDDSFTISVDDERISVTDVSVAGDTMTYSVLGGSFAVSRSTSPDYCSTRP